MKSANTYLGVSFGAKKSGPNWYSVVNWSVRWDCPFLSKRTAEKWARLEIYEAQTHKDH
jgi:hypothetical protein